MTTNLSFNSIEIDKVNGLMVDVGTGEILENSESNVNLMIKNQKEIDSLNKAKEKESKELAGIEDFKDLHYTNWKSGKKVQFIKIYRTELREYNKTTKLSPNAGLFLFHIQTYIELHTNRIAKPNRDNFTNKELMKLTGLSDKTLKNTLNELEDKHYIARNGNRQAREIYFNPYLMCSGVAVLKEVVDVFFKDYTPITEY